jgi:hypothetical protein
MRIHCYSRTAARLFGLSLAAIFLSACASKGPTVRADFDRGVDFNAYRTFGFPATTGTDRGGYSTLITSYFKEAVKREMSVRGYEYTDTEPQLIVNFYSEARDKTEVVSRPGAFTGYGYGYYGYGGPWPRYGYGYPRYGYPRYGMYSSWPFYNDIDVVNYTSGIFKLDVVDAKREQAIWEARVEERLSEESQDNPQPNIAHLVTEMFRKFPRGAAANATAEAAP